MDQSQAPAPCFYRLAHGISVREEKFGLLFYNPNGPQLTFVHSGPWIDLELFSGKVPLKQWIHEKISTDSGGMSFEMEKNLLRTLTKLVEKGLIVETMAAL